MQKLLRLINLLFLVVLDNPVLNFLLEDIAGPLYKIGEESNNQ